MSIQVLTDVIVPASVVAAAMTGRQQRQNQRSQNQGGYQSVNVIWSRTLREYTLGIAPLLSSQWQQIEGLHEVTSGGAYGMLLVDPKDSMVGVTSGLLWPYLAGATVGTNGSGWGVPAHRLYKRMTALGTTRTYDRAITRPQPTPVVTRNGSAVTPGAGAGQIAIDLTTGTVTFVADASANVTAVTVGATTQVTLASALAGLAVGGRLYLNGLAGAGAALLNGLSHPITAIAGAVYTLGTATTGATITPAGQGYKYPQPTDALAWTGAFYVPVHFQADVIDWQLIPSGGGAEAGRVLSGPSVVLEEVRE